MEMISKRRLVLLGILVAAFPLLLANSLHCDCLGDDFVVDDDSAGDDDDDDTTVVDDDSADDDSVAEPFRIEGMVFIEAFYFEEDDEVEGLLTQIPLAWTDIDPDGYPYGSVYVGITEGFDQADEPLFHFSATTIPDNPADFGIPFQFAPEVWPEMHAHVMGVADTHHDGVISAWDSMAFHPTPIDTTGPAVHDAHVVIEVEFVWSESQQGWVPGEYGEGGGSGEGCPDCPGDPAIPVVLSGDEFLHESAYTAESGNGLVGIYGAQGDGPYWTTIPGRLDGAAQDEMLPWELQISANHTALIYGAWDWNDNGLFEPSDEWGATVTEIDGAEINPWTIGETSIEDLLIRVPLEGINPPLPPAYISITGDVTTDATFDWSDLPAGSTMWVMAARNWVAEIHEQTFEEVYNNTKLWCYVRFDNAETLTDPVPYELWVPSRTTVYLYVMLDTVGDGSFDEAYRLSDHGDYLMVIGTTADTQRDLEMTYSP